MPPFDDSIVQGQLGLAGDHQDGPMINQALGDLADLG